MKDFWFLLHEDVRDRRECFETSRILYIVLWSANNNEPFALDLAECDQSIAVRACQESRHPGRLFNTEESDSARPERNYSNQNQRGDAHFQLGCRQWFAYTGWEL